VLLSFSALTKFDSGNQFPRLRGILSFTVDDLKRYGVGGGGVAVGLDVLYARTWDGCAMKLSPSDRVRL
jgi:hypothetical protein